MPRNAPRRFPVLGQTSYGVGVRGLLGQVIERDFHHLGARYAIALPCALRATGTALTEEELETISAFQETFQTERDAFLEHTPWYVYSSNCDFSTLSERCLITDVHFVSSSRAASTPNTLANDMTTFFECASCCRVIRTAPPGFTGIRFCECLSTALCCSCAKMKTKKVPGHTCTPVLDVADGIVKLLLGRSTGPYVNLVQSGERTMVVPILSGLSLAHMIRTDLALDLNHLQTTFVIDHSALVFRCLRTALEADPLCKKCKLTGRR
jgi:hypothetical protein